MERDEAPVARGLVVPEIRADHGALRVDVDRVDRAIDEVGHEDVRLGDGIAGGEHEGAAVVG